MKSSIARRGAYGSACGALAVLAFALAGPASAAKPVKKAKAKPAEAAAPKAYPIVTPIDTGSPSILSRRAIETAGAYRAYMDRAARISSAFKSGAEVEASLMNGAQADAQQLSQGVIAYAAVLALSDPSFVAGVRSQASDADSRRELARRIIENPNLATTLPVSASAVGPISAGLGADGSRVAGAGALVKQAAYDVQHSAWSKASVPSPLVRLAKAKSLSLMTMKGTEAELAAIARSVAAADAITPANAVTTASMSAPTTPTVSRGLAIAALAALGAGGEADEGVVLSLMNDPNAGFCMSMSKLNLNQCLSVSRPYYEDVFCLGQHILIDIGQCVVKGAGQSPVPMAAATFACGGDAAASQAPAVAAYAAPR
ncbi:hypothetical protein BH09PSE2_BH09PSE2_14080 [soil metagenome]